MTSSVGINYGQIANNLPTPENVIPLVKSIGATRVKLYDADPKVLRAFANTGVEFIVRFGNENMANMRNPEQALAWLNWRLSDESSAEDCSEKEKDPSYGESITCKVFLGFTSNLISSGVRETVRYLVEHHMVDVVVTTAGGMDEDLIKCLAPTYKGDFSLPGAQLRSKGFVDFV